MSTIHPLSWHRKRRTALFEQAVGLSVARSLIEGQHDHTLKAVSRLDARLADAARKGVTEMSDDLRRRRV